MENQGLTDTNRSLIRAREERLLKSNGVSQRFGLTLSAAQARALIAAERQTLRDYGRLEFGEGILPRLIYGFCDSPYIARGDYTDTLEALQALFYAFQNDLEDTLTDDELLEAMHAVFHGRAQGSLEYLETVDMKELLAALRSGGDDGDCDDGSDGHGDD
jgi:hypothetical protein